MDDTKIIEKGKQSLSFVEQLQNQIELCRTALSNPEIYLTPSVEALEVLLWGKLKGDKAYLNRISELNKGLENERNYLMNKKINQGFRCYDWQIEEEIIPYQRKQAQEKFKAIMIFIEKENLMPYGEEND